MRGALTQFDYSDAGSGAAGSHGPNGFTKSTTAVKFVCFLSCTVSSSG